VRIRCELSKLGSPESGSPAQNITRDPYLTFRQLVRAPRGIECDPGESTEGSVKNLSRTTRPEHKDLLALVFSHWKSAIRRSRASPRARSSRSRNRVKHISGTILDRKHPERTESVEQVLDLNGAGRAARLAVHSPSAAQGSPSVASCRQHNARQTCEIRPLRDDDAWRARDARASCLTTYRSGRLDELSDVWTSAW